LIPLPPGESEFSEIPERCPAGWKKFEPLWDMAIRLKRVTAMLPVLESVLTGFGSVAERLDKFPTSGDEIPDGEPYDFGLSELLLSPSTPVSISRKAA
jgi:hypothetical protein